MLTFNSVGVKMLLCFSLYSNGKYTLSTEKKPGSRQIYCLNGMRFLSMSWVMVGHFALDMPFAISYTIEPYIVSRVTNEKRNTT